MGVFDDFDKNLEISEDFINALPEAKALQEKAAEAARAVQNCLTTEAMENWLTFADLVNQRSAYVAERLFELGFQKGQTTTTKALGWINRQRRAISTFVEAVAATFETLSPASTTNAPQRQLEFPIPI